jgi:hypothetical protein
VLPSPRHFEQLAELVTEDAANDGQGRRAPDVGKYVDAVQQYVDAGYDEVYLSQVGPDQAGFFDFWERELAPALKDL